MSSVAPGFVDSFEAECRLTGEHYKVRFSHLWSAVATRHADTLDCKFFVNGRPVIVALALTGLLEYRRQNGRVIPDALASQVAAYYLKQRLEEADERSHYEASAEEVVGLMRRCGFLRG
jgi:hypothetical protein